MRMFISWIVIYVDNRQGQVSVLKPVSGSRVRSFNAAATLCVGDAISVVIIKFRLFSLTEVRLMMLLYFSSFGPGPSDQTNLVCGWTMLFFDDLAD
jgi:nucleoside permease NupC